MRDDQNRITPEQLLEARTSRQLTLGEAADHISHSLGRPVSRVMVKGWERGERMIPDDLTPAALDII